MAQYNDEIILNITTNYGTAVNEIVRLTNELGKLKADMAGVRQAQKDGNITSDEANKKLEALNAEYRKINASIRSYRKEIDANLEAEEANNGSLKEMRAQLKNLIKEYDALSQTDREAIGGVGEEKLLEIRRLQEELKQAEEASGRFQRSVGSYEDAIRRALDGTTPMKQAMRELKTEIQTTEFQYRQMGDTIKQREQELIQLGQAVGTDTEDYKQQAAELEALKQQYDATGKSLNDMKVAAGQMDDAMKDANQSIANFGKDNANLKAMTQGAQLLLNSYTALKAGMTALGVESEELYNVFSKIQILQQGLNAVTQIANMLEKQYILSQQARLLWTKLTTTSIATLTAAKKKDAAASAAAAAGDTTLAAGEVAATAAAGGLTTALKAVGAAIKSIPIIGWIAAAVAGLATLTALIVRASKASKDNNETLKERIRFQRELLDIEKQALTSVKQQEIQLKANVQRVKELETGTDEWKRGVEDIANSLGVDAEWLQENIDKVDELTDAWVRMQVAMAKGQAYAQKMAENEIKIAQANAQIEAIMASENKDKKRIKALQTELGITEKLAKTIAKTYKKKDDSAKDYANYANAVNTYTAGLEKQNETFKNGIDDAMGEASKAGEILNEGVKKAGNTAVQTAKSVAKSVTKSAKELSEELEDLMVEGMADGLEKQVRQVEIAAERYVEKMKEARDADLENKEKYDEIILQYEKNTQDKIRKLRSDGYQQIIEGAAKITESYNNLWSSNAPNSFYNFVNEINGIAKDVSDEVKMINNQIRELEDQISQYKATKASETITLAKSESVAKDLQSQLKEKLPEIKVPVKPEIVVDGFKMTEASQYLGSELMDYGFEKEVADEYEKKWLDSLEKIRQKVLSTGKDIHTVIDEVSTPMEEALGVETPFNAAYNRFLDENEGVLDDLEQYGKDLAAYNKRVAENSRIEAENAEVVEKQTKAENEAAEARKRLQDATDNLEKAEEKLNEVENDYQSKFGENILINRQLNKSLQEYAKTIQQVLLEQAKLGNIRIIPDSFQTYIDYQIDKLEEEIAKSYGRLERMATKLSVEAQGEEGVNTQYVEESQRYNELLAKLEQVKQARKSVTKDFLAVDSDGGFFSNDELTENYINIGRLQAQIAVMNKVFEEGVRIEGEISRYERENNELYNRRLELLAEIGAAEDEAARAAKQKELEQVDGQIAANNEIITSQKEMLALMGYTTEEEMQQLLSGLNSQMNAFSKQTGVIMRKTAASVMQSIGTMVSSLADLMNEIGEDNAQMANFLEAMAYTEIGVNMAVGISEAISAGAGMPFPYNLAAIAAGVAAVISGIASAISTYKKYHQEVSSPRFAQGGYVSGEKGVDKIPAWLSDGEYVIKRKRVQELGVPFLDALNQGRSIIGKTHFAEGGYVASTMATQIMVSEESRQMLIDAMSEISPVVSVREIARVQNRVNVKDNIAKSR